MATFKYLDDKRDLLHVCWAWKARTEKHGYIIHLVAAHGQTTVCGKNIATAPYPWQYEVWSQSNNGWGLDHVGCLSCKKSARKQIELTGEQ